ncbi:MAG: PPC domain-containing protein, partial [Anaerolineales bacterium]
MPRVFMLVGVLALIVLLPTFVGAQDTAASTLEPGVAVEATLDNENFAQNFVFSGASEDAITLDAFTESDDLALVMWLTGPDGAILARDTDPETPEDALIGDFALPEDGQYIVTVARANGAAGETSGDFTLTLSGSLTPIAAEATATPQPPTTSAPATGADFDVPTVTLQQGGINIALSWDAATNMNLEVRDPLGGAIFNTNPVGPNGGSLSEDINADCETATADNPTERISWDAGQQLGGSYEIIVYYVDGCAVNLPQQFTISASVNSEEARTINGTLNPGQSYMAAVNIEPDGSWNLFNGGVNAGLDINLVATQIAEAQPLPGVQAQGVLTRDNPAEAYTFEGVAGDSIILDMETTAGSLDTYLILLGPNGQEIARNDDRDDTSTNSLIQQTLAQNGIYTVVATRYAQTIGGTEGAYVLDLGLSVPEAATGSATTPPTNADTTTTETATTDTNTAEAEPTVPPDPITGAGTTTTTVRPEGLPEGSVEIILTWNSTADVQLLVRDPQGIAIYDDNPSAPSGGILEEVGNARCAGNSNPVSYIYWPTSLLPRGIYEIDIWYQDNCQDPNPVTFNLIVNVQGETVIETTQPATLDSHYGVTFEIDPDGNATASEGGFFDMDSAASIDYFDLLNTAEPIEYGDTITAEITSAERFLLYGF